MELINDLSTMINDTNGGIFVFGYYLPSDEYIINRIIEDVLQNVNKPICNDFKKRIKYPNSTNRKVNFEMSSNSIMVLNVDDIIDSYEDDKFNIVVQHSKIFSEFRDLTIKKKNSVIVKAQLYKAKKEYKPQFNIRYGSSFEFSSNYYCNVREGMFIVLRSRYRNNKDYTSDLKNYIRENKLDILLN